MANPIQQSTSAVERVLADVNALMKRHREIDEEIQVHFVTFFHFFFFF